MARPKAFDIDQALDAAIGVFREHGYAGTSASMLTDAMRIGRQSLYDTFGDKWQLYCAAVLRYSAAECRAHTEALKHGPKAIDGLRQMLDRVATEAHLPCLGLGSISEFGTANKELAKLREGEARSLRKAIVVKIKEAQAQGDASPELDPEQAADFMFANITALRMAARSGASQAALQSLEHMALRSLR